MAANPNSEIQAPGVLAGGPLMLVADWIADFGGVVMDWIAGLGNIAIFSLRTVRLDVRPAAAEGDASCRTSTRSAS